MATPTVTFNNGLSVPVLGLGTWLATHDCKEAIKTAIDLGYRHIDTALVYQNESLIGEAVRDKIADGTVKREDMFITSKLWNTYHRPDLVEKGCKKTLKNFGLDYIDLYLIHWPMAFKPTDLAEEDSKNHKDLASIMADPEFIPVDSTGQIVPSTEDYVDTWRAMEDLVQRGWVKSIGVSNFNPSQMERLMAAATILPVTNQVECHPYLNQKKLIDFCKKHHILLTAYSPLGSANPSPKVEIPKLVSNPVIGKVAKAVKRTPAQVVLRYLIQNGVIPIPKSTNAERLKENLAVFDFELNASQMKNLDELDCGLRYCIMKGTENDANFPFNEEM